MSKVLSNHIKNGRAAIGIDPSRGFHKVALLSRVSSEETIINIPNLPSAVNILEEKLQKQLNHTKLPVVIEGYGGCGERFVLSLLERGYPVYELNPKKSANLREAFSENSDDERDARIFAVAALHFPEVLSPVKITVEEAAIKKLARARQTLVKQRTKAINRLHRVLLDSYGIIYKRLFRDLSSKKALRFFEAYPIINSALKDPDGVKRLIGPSSWNKLETVGKWKEDVYLEMLEIQVKTLIEQISLLTEQKKSLSEKLAELLGKYKSEALEKLSGAGPAIKGYILGETGIVERFPNTDSYVAYCGLAPATKQSGEGAPRQKRRKKYNRRLRWAFRQLALTKMREDGPSRDYYLKKLREGKSKGAALMALARWLARIVYRMLKDRTSYQWPRQGG